MGFKIDSVVSGIFNDYDHNQNGVIEYKNTSKASESYKESVSGHYDAKNVYHEDKITVSNRKLFTDADSNKDGFVSKNELTKFVSKFDNNKNGELNFRKFEDWALSQHKEQAEYMNFIKAYPEKTVNPKK